MLAAGSGIAAMIQIFMTKTESTKSVPSHNTASQNFITDDESYATPKVKRNSNNKHNSMVNNDSVNNDGENPVIDNPATKINCVVSGKVSNSRESSAS